MERIEAGTLHELFYRCGFWRRGNERILSGENRETVLYIWEKSGMMVSVAKKERTEVYLLWN